MAFDVIVIGAGAAGLMSAYRAARRGCHVLLVEKPVRSASK
ncbi:MAG: FAD-dependent oxidoreductase, partial [Anaerolineae bacterium]|nr:FAD-dependent oxidoreductase [Anaerolineae bacterium]